MSSVNTAQTIGEFFRILNSISPYFLGLSCDTVDMSVSLPSDKLLEIKELTYSLLRQPITVHQVMSFLGRLPYVQMDMYSFAGCVMSFRVTH